MGPVSKWDMPSTSKYLEDSFSVSLSSTDSKSSVRLRRTNSLMNFTLGHYAPAEFRKLKERLLRTNPRVEPSALRKFNKTQMMTLFSLALVDFMCFCSMSIMAPFFPREATEKGLSNTMSGFVFSFYALVMFLTSPFFGKIIPKVGAKFLFLSGIFVAGICNLLFGLLEFVNDYYLFTIFCFVIRGLEALGASAFSTASFVFVVNTFPNNIGAVLGILETFVGLGMSTGPAIGGLLYSIGGFETPFFVLGIAMMFTVPINMCLLPVTQTGCDVNARSVSMLSLMKVPAVVVISLVIVAVSSAWAFLDPTLEPHLREFNLSPEQIGFIFLLFSALYGIFSPIWGWLTDKLSNHWHMMATGLVFSTIGLLLLGPSPFLPFLKNTIQLNIIALSILGISVALALLPTFQGVLNSAIEDGCSNNIPTYSLVAGIWSCMYSLGEVLGPSIGGILLQYYGFPIASTVMAAVTCVLAIVTWLFYCVKRRYTHNRIISSPTSSIFDISDYSETTPLLVPSDYDHSSYTQEKVQYFGHSRKLDHECGDIDSNQITDVRGTITITSKGACEV